MTDRERFLALMTYQPIDRLPRYIFGTWEETRERWAWEGIAHEQSLAAAFGLDEDWEAGMWDAHGLVNPWPLCDEPEVVLEDTADWQLVRTGLGGIERRPKGGSSIAQHVEAALLPTRASWERFKHFLNPDEPRRRPDGWQAQASALQRRTRVATFMAGSLYGWLRDWMGVEGISFAMYDEPELFAEMVAYMADYFLTLYRPVLPYVTFDFAYFFEDCCGRSGPLFSPAAYRQFFHPHYQRMIEEYRGAGIPFVLLDSDGYVEDLIPCWLDSGIDVLFPIEIGTWHADPVALRQRYGKRLRMMGGFDKHLIPQGEAAVRGALEHLRPLIAEGGFLPIPDHRIPPDCSVEQFREYVRVFKDFV